jgi:hypothetical protein
MGNENYMADGAGSNLEALTRDYTPFAQLPEYWHFKLSQTKEGQTPAWLTDNVTYKSFGKIPVSRFMQENKKHPSLGKTWRDYKGDAWYATELPEKNKFRNKKAYLVFGSVRGTAGIYVNGKLISQEKHNWRRSFAIRIDQYLKNRDNTLFVKISDCGSASGIWRPVWLFTGGPAPEKADDPKGENLIKNSDFSQGFKYWYAPTKDAYSFEEDKGAKVLTIKGVPELGKKNGYVACVERLKWLKKDEVTGRKFAFGVTLEVAKISEELFFSVRELDADRKTVVYHTIRLKKGDQYDWKTLTKTFTTSPKTVSLRVYIVARNLPADDRVRVKDLSLCYAK